jgi:hypothetical protein
MAAALLFQLRTDSSRLAAKPNFGLTEGIMSTATIVSAMQLREPELLGQTVVVIGGSGGISLKRRDEHPWTWQVTLAGRNPERLQRAS